ncbi:MAG TPA: hypothetical protein PLO67_08345 [Saprospiraceae bacterium]|nr:hypothetical protein [Saprospiraceae bacterium]
MKRISIICILLWFATNQLIAQNGYWEAAVGPYGGNSNIIPTNSNRLYARHSHGFFHRSTDYGLHWQPFEIQSADVNAYSEELYIAPSGNFYSLVLKQGGNNWAKYLYRSTDDGQTWELRSNQPYLTHVWETPSGNLIGYDPSQNLYRSTDAGLTWQSVGQTNLNMSPYTTTISFGSGNRILLADWNGLVYSLNDGQTWNEGGDSGSFFNQVTMTSSGTIFRIDNGDLTPGSLVHLSNDWGFNWTPANISLDYEEYPQTIMEIAGGRLLMTTNTRIHYSDDSGVTWYVLPTGAERANWFYTSSPLPNGDLIGQYKDATYRSSDAGATWTFSAYGMKLAQTKQLALLSDSVQLAVTSNGLWRTADAGDSWDRLLPDTGEYVYTTHPVAVLNADRFGAVLGQNLWWTQDGGQHFSDVTPPHSLTRGFLFAANQNQLFTTDTLGVVLSNDFGLSWHSVLPGEIMVDLEQHPDGTLFALTAPFSLTTNTRLLRSSDGGWTWENIVVPGLQPTGFFDLTISADGELLVNGLGTHSLKIARSSDLGENWTDSVIPDGYAHNPLTYNALDHIFTAAGSNTQIFSSVDQGQSWYFLPKYSDHASLMNSLEVSPSGRLYIVPSSAPVYRSSKSTVNGGYIRGTVRRDADADCSTPDAQEPIKNWIVEISGAEELVVNTSATGQYAVFTDTGQYSVRTRVAQNLWWALCDSLFTVQVDSAQTVDSVDFVAIATSECPLMTTDVAIPFLRRCFDNMVYVSYCNVGAEPADSAWVDVLLDPYLSLVGSEQPYEALGNNTFRFQVGNVEWGDCGQFTLTVHVDCDSTIIGQTHCITTHGFPDTLCNPVPGWSGATIQASASCQDSVVRLQLRNTGTNTSSFLNYIIIEDDVVLLQNQKQYEIGETFNLDYPANGHTWRVESQQEPGHPFSNLALAFLEGCGGFQTLGYVNRFSVNGWEPSIDRECVENTGAYDPNDKQGFPLGYGSDHRIRPGQALEYMIRFQNTGTDTAFTVQIRDTLSAWLDPGTIRPGASSHPYTWSLSGQGVLRFQFDDIMLPDSNVNLAGSQGFISFQIDQKQEVPLETQITNTAAIYFDFNTPVITNQTLHTVGIDYVTAVQDVKKPEVPVMGIQPNPASSQTMVGLPPGTERLMMFDALGRCLRILPARGAKYRLERENLPAGVYGLRAEDRKGNLVGVGKVIWK